ncbi:bifunctional alpha,alpha-trehalose-phosphate synthase (UDP-forming)/trehalose-phosphatase [Flavobacterium sp. MK4S-17]|uniref:bifunctional alpha,alpha-trehalose-phosphate synthase (UDP-forming)/trehalose-phosphatase n=1 Tax=Flavobacterium sp. MK4S-17 TaxID=2543737 RepID=UPI0013581562|nr:bifunctional alpha,alpha-trehalose-phosphate synthase (UDP-forming)/trehalose-phosphatase [Flavobacterium sp. MK4S-17]
MKIITISYRLPLSIKKQKGKVKITQSAGGLATAILSYSQKSDVNLTWVGIADFDKTTWENNKDRYDRNFDIEPVFLERSLNRQFYNIFSNSVLWALFHYFPSYVEYTDASFEAYTKANAIVAEKVNSIYEPGDIIWIHDYHFMGLAKIIREYHPDAKIGYFLHIPFPNFELFRILPNKAKKYILEGVLGSNLIGFHTWDNVIHFTECVEKILGLSHKNFLFSQDTHRSKIGSYPISIDFDKFHDAFDKENVITLRNEIKSLYEDKRIIFSVDRLDYTKGITNRLNAFEKFLQKYPEWREKVVFLLVLVPSREEIKKYGERKRMIELTVGRINGNMGNYKWTPIVYQYQSVDFDKLIALYTSADVALISPVRDGMNLVAKEYVASRKDLKGALILSSMAGAAKELKEAITINPFDAEMIADKISLVLNMSEDEQHRRIKRMQDYIKKHDVFHWAETFLNDTEESHKQDSKSKMLQKEERKGLIEKFNTASKRLLLLDFDGTLVNLQSRPELATPDDRVINILSTLAENPKNEVWIISGRNREFLQQWLGHLPIGLVAEHGGYIKRDDWQPVIQGIPEWKGQVVDIMQNYVDTNSGSFIEIKEFGIAFHYRNVDEKQGFNSSRELLMLLKNHLYNTPTQIIDGNKVIEVKHYMAHKGTTCKNNVLCGDHDFVLAFGDDKTDEDLFEMLTAENEYSVKVGPGNTFANYRLESVEEVLSFLATLAGLTATEEKQLN